MAKVIFSFDTEDYINPEADDYTKRICEVFDANGVTASFMMVGERARVLVERGRVDVIAALGRHEIGYHSYFHSVHPNVAEYLDGCGWYDGVGEFLSREQEGVSLVRQIFNRECLWAAVPAGASWAPQMICGYERLGIPIQSDAAITAPRNRPTHYIGQLHLKYNLWLDHLLLADSWDPIGAQFDEHLEAGAQLIVAIDHPTILMHEQFPDSLNFRHGRNPPPSEWVCCTQRPVARQEMALAHLERTIRHVLEHPDLEPCTYEQIAGSFDLAPGGSVGPQALGAVAAHVSEGALCSIETGGNSFSAADQFGLLNHAAAHGGDAELPVLTPLRRLLGPINDVCVEDGRAFEAPSGQVRRAARHVEHDLRGHMPATIQFEGRRVGPATFMRGLARIVGGAAEGRLPASVPFEPAPPLPDEAQMEGLRDLTWKDRWEIFPPDFAGDNLKRHALLQSWTIRPGVEKRP